MNKLINLSIDVIKGDRVGSVFIGRPTVLGNMFVIGKDGNRAEVIEKFRVSLWQDFKVKGEKYKECVRLAEVLKSKGSLKLSCYCAPLGCHGDVIKKAVLWLIESGVA
jgi:hypothetical protein